MKTEIFVLKNGVQHLAGTFSLQNEVIVSQPEEGYEAMMKGMFAVPVFKGGQKVSPVLQPFLWLKTLPQTYNGTYLRAEFSE